MRNDSFSPAVPAAFGQSGVAKGSCARVDIDPIPIMPTGGMKGIGNNTHAVTGPDRSKTVKV